MYFIQSENLIALTALKKGGTDSASHSQTIANTNLFHLFQINFFILFIVASRPSDYAARPNHPNLWPFQHFYRHKPQKPSAISMFAHRLFKQPRHFNFRAQKISLGSHLEIPLSFVLCHCHCVPAPRGILRVLAPFLPTFHPQCR
jgi:hypothetical protein